MHWSAIRHTMTSGAGAAAASLQKSKIGIIRGVGLNNEPPREYSCSACVPITQHPLVLLDRIFIWNWRGCGALLKVGVSSPPHPPRPRGIVWHSARNIHNFPRRHIASMPLRLYKTTLSIPSFVEARVSLHFVCKLVYIPLPCARFTDNHIVPFFVYFTICRWRSNFAESVRLCLQTLCICIKYSFCVLTCRLLQHISL